MKKIFLKIMLGVVLVCALFVGFLYANNDIGVTSTNLEADIRSSQKIKDDWTVDGSVSDTMAAYISYPQDTVAHFYIRNKFPPLCGYIRLDSDFAFGEVTAPPTLPSRYAHPRLSVSFGIIYLPPNG